MTPTPQCRQSTAAQAVAASGGQSGGKVVGLGSCGLDYLAALARFPRPDDKVRTERLETQGGGNCANALTVASRLGLQAALVSQIGDDGIGEQILAELQDDGVDTTHVLRAAGSPSPFTYIIVDQEGSTRTCIHTPAAPLMPDQITPDLTDAVLGDNTRLVYFDGRLTEAALLLACAARAAGCAVLVEAERLRPNLEALLAEADYVVMSAHYPQDWTGERELGDALVTCLRRLPHARWLLCTLGKRGSVLLQRCGRDECRDLSGGEVLQELMDSAFERLQRQEQGPGEATAIGGAAVRAGRVLLSEKGYRLLLQRGDADDPHVSQAAHAAAQHEASSNADAANASGYRTQTDLQLSSFDDTPDSSADVFARLVVASAADLAQDAVVDTTGAGDAFIGSVLYALCHDMPLDRMLRLAAVVAACNCTALGARGGAPRRDAVSADLL